MTGNFVVGRLEYAAVITAHVIAFVIRLGEDQITIRNRQRSFQHEYDNNIPKVR